MRSPLAASFFCAAVEAGLMQTPSAAFLRTAFRLLLVAL